MSERTRLKPIDDDWTMDMIDAIAEHLVSPKVIEKYAGEYIGAWAPTIAIRIAIIVDEHIHKNGYELRKIVDDKPPERSTIGTLNNE